MDDRATSSTGERGPGRLGRAGNLALATLVVLCAALQVLLWVQRAHVAANWEELARRELAARSEGIVDFIRERGERALADIRAVARDPDTHALLSAEGQLSQTARRPVFLDLMGRFPPDGTGGATVYDIAGSPRAWSGWAPTATMSLARQPSPESEIMRIRGGNIYTLLEATRPIRDEQRRLLGYIAYQEPLRVQFPVENQFLEVEDLLHELEGGGGVRADVTLSLLLEAGREGEGIRAGPLELSSGAGVVSSTCPILKGSDRAIGQVSLTGLSRDRFLAERLSLPAKLRDWLVAAFALLIAVRLWFWLERWPGSVLSRSALVVLSRDLHRRLAGQGDLDLLGIFDPSWFASLRYGGLLRSPGDLLLTTVALLLIARELRRFLLRRESSLRALASRRTWLVLLPGLVAPLLVGSLLGFHWHQVADVARNANVPLFGGLDPFTSAPVAALEAGLLFGGAAFLAVGDTLLGLAAVLLAVIPRRLRLPLLAALALLASAVKMGAPSQVALADFLRPLPALGALFAFHFLARRWRRLRPGPILAAAALAAIANSSAVGDGIEARRRQLVELKAMERAESPSNSRHFLLQTTLEHLGKSPELPRVLAGEPNVEQGNIAFLLWARSPLANVGAGCLLRLLDRNGQAVSAFNLGYPPELREQSRREVAAPTGGRSQFRREEMGSERYDIYYGHLPIAPKGEDVLGFLELSLAYVDRVGQSAAPGDGLASVFGETIKSPEFLRFSRDVPDRVDRYRGDLLVASTDPEGGFGKQLPSVVARALATAETTGRWVERRISGKLYDLYCIRERDGERTVGYLTFGLRRGGWLGWGSLLARSVLVTLVLACGLLAFFMLTSWLVPESSRRLGVPRLGFRERVIAGFLLVSLVPTVLLGFAGRGLFVREKRQEYRERLEEDLRVTGELLSRRLSDAARNAAGSAEVVALLARTHRAANLSSPASVDGIAVVSADGNVLGASPGAMLDLAAVAADLPIPEISAEFYLRREDALYAGALVPLAEEAGGGDRGAVFAYKRIDRVLAAELERRVGSPISFFANGTLRATSNPELYQSEILSDLVESMAYLKVELEGARRTTLESRVGATSFLTSYAPLTDAAGRPVGIRAALAPFRGAGLDLDASNVLSRIYFLCLIVLAAACQAAVLLAGRLTRPISELTAGAERLGAGELGYRIATRASGEIGGLVRSFNSMSERLAASEARDRERREYIEAIIQHVGSGVVSVDASGAVATVNEAAGRILGVPPAALLGRRLGADAPAEPAALGGLGAAAATLLAGEEREVVREIEIPPSGEGEPRKLRLVGTPLLGHAGKPQGAVLVFEDLTELIRSEKIKAWAQMARQVAHEIKNPLTPMKLSAQHLRQAWRDKHGKFDRILEESTETIIDRCEALRRIAIEFSDYARMPGRKIRREDLGRLLRDAERLYAESGERGVKLRLDAPEEMLWTRVDRDEVMRLFINLIENSVQAMPQGGELSITAWTENGMAHVRIRDTGVGIDSENLGRIFEPSFSTKTGGAGLGLPICKAIVEDYGGSIRIESEKGRGTTVEVTLPAEDAPPAGGAART